jgi:hypothetical protein
MALNDISRRALLGASAAGVVGSIVSSAHAAPTVGKAFPRFTTTNLEGNATTHRGLHGRISLAVVVTSPSASDLLDKWMLETQASFPDTVVRRVVFLAFDLAFIVPTGVVRNRARDKVPRQYWKDTMLDVHGDLVKQLGLGSGSDKPFVYALNKTGVVTAAVRGALDDRTRPVVWSALRR